MEQGGLRGTGILPAVPLSRPSKVEAETGNFASPSRGGFALFGDRRWRRKIDTQPHNRTIGQGQRKLERSNQNFQLGGAGQRMPRCSKDLGVSECSAMRARPALIQPWPRAVVRSLNGGSKSPRSPSSNGCVCRSTRSYIKVRHLAGERFNPGTSLPGDGKGEPAWTGTEPGRATAASLVWSGRRESNPPHELGKLR